MITRFFKVIFTDRALKSALLADVSKIDKFYYYFLTFSDFFRVFFFTGSLILFLFNIFLYDNKQQIISKLREEVSLEEKKDKKEEDLKYKEKVISKNFNLINTKIIKFINYFFIGVGSILFFSYSHSFLFFFISVATSLLMWLDQYEDFIYNLNNKKGKYMIAATLFVLFLFFLNSFYLFYFYMDSFHYYDDFIKIYDDLQNEKLFLFNEYGEFSKKFKENLCKEIYSFPPHKSDFSHFIDKRLDSISYDEDMKEICNLNSPIYSTSPSGYDLSTENIVLENYQNLSKDREMISDLACGCNEALEKAKEKDINMLQGVYENISKENLEAFADNRRGIGAFKEECSYLEKLNDGIEKVSNNKNITENYEKAKLLVKELERINN